MRSTIIALIALSSISVCSLSAQQSRGDLLEEAGLEFDVARRLALLGAAANPALGPLDSLWASGVHELAQALIEEGEESQAQAWLRWSSWLAPQWPIDTIAFLPEVVQAYRTAQTTVQTRLSPADSVALASWEWPASIDAGAQGAFRVGTRSATPLSVQVNGEEISAGSSIELPVGTYELVASVEGYDDVRVIREALPGVTTVIDFSPLPRLSDTGRQAAEAALVAVRAMTAAPAVCETGFVATSDGLVLTSYDAVRNGDRVAERVEVSGGGVGRSVTAARVAAFDRERNVAVLALDEATSSFLTAGIDPRPGEYGWSVGQDGCSGPADATRVRIASASSATGLTFTASVGVQGTPLVDQQGRLSGLVTGAGEAASLAQIQALLARARPVVVAGLTDQSGEGGGAPWGWIAGGAGVVGLAVALLAGGGGGGGTEDTTGDLVISWIPQ